MTTSLKRWLEQSLVPPDAGDWEWYPAHGDPPVTDTELQRLEREPLSWILLRHFRGRPDVYVGSDMFVYYEQYERRKKVSPDVFVCFGVPSRMRRVYKTWEDDHGLDWVLEIVSRGTWKEDMIGKRKLYAERMGVREYFVYDPEGEYLDAPLLHFLRHGDELVQQPMVEPARYHSKLLGLELVIRPEQREIGKWRLDFHLPDGTRLRRPDEAIEHERHLRFLETEARRRETEARKAAEAETVRLRKELQRLRQERGDGTESLP